MNHIKAEITSKLDFYLCSLSTADRPESEIIAEFEKWQSFLSHLEQLKSTGFPNDGLIGIDHFKLIIFPSRDYFVVTIECMILNSKQHIQKLENELEQKNNRDKFFKSFKNSEVSNG